MNHEPGLASWLQLTLTPGLGAASLRAMLRLFGGLSVGEAGAALSGVSHEADPDDDDIHLLPMWDAFLMSHRDRSRYLDPKHAPYVVDRGGNTTNVIVEKGRVAGIWDLDGATLLYATFRKVAKSRIAEAAERVGAVQDVESVREIKEPKPLDRQNDFQAPLRRRA